MRRDLLMRAPRVPGDSIRLTYPWSQMQIGDDFLIPLALFRNRTLAQLQKRISSYASGKGSFTTKRTGPGLVVRRIG